MTKKFSAQALAGLCLFIAGFVVFMGIITAEAYYPTAYSTSTNEISDLGSTCPPESLIHQPSATVFNVSMMLVGIFILLAAYFLAKEQANKSFVVFLSLFGIGVLGVGLFPGNTPPHPFFALLTFTSGGISAIRSATITRPPFRYASVVLGVTALLALFFSGFFAQYLGDGGIERWVAYPTTLWMTGMGGYLLGISSKKD